MNTLPNTSGVYAIRNIINDKRYIGSSTNIRVRAKAHIKALTDNCHHAVALQRAWNKYGPEAFVFDVLEECPPTQTFAREQFWLDLKEWDYNSSHSAIGTVGYKHTVEQVQANSQRSKKRWSCSAARTAQSETIKRWYSVPENKKAAVSWLAEGRAKLTREMLVSKYTDEVREKIRITAERRAVKHEVLGDTMTLLQALKKFGITKSTIEARMRRGWTLEESVTTPTNKKNTKIGARVNEYNGVLYTLQELVPFAKCSKTALFRRLKSGMSVEDAVEMTPEQAEARRLSLFRASRGK